MRDFSSPKPGRAWSRASRSAPSVAPSQTSAARPPWSATRASQRALGALGHALGEAVQRGPLPELGHQVLGVRGSDGGGVEPAPAPGQVVGAPEGLLHRDLLVEQHAHQQGEGVGAEQGVGLGIAGHGERGGGHGRHRTGAVAALPRPGAGAVVAYGSGAMPAAPVRRARHLRLLTVVAALALVVAACSGGDDEGEGVEGADAALTERTPVTAADLGPFALSTEGMAGPGTPLGAGLEVPEGAVLLGVPFPDLVGEGYRALLLVPGDPVAVFATMSEQAGGLGMSADGGCLNVFDQLGCAATFTDAADGEALTLRLSRRIGFSGVISGLALRYEPPGSIDPGDAPPDAAPPPTDPVTPFPLPEGPVAPPDPADVVLALRDPASPARAVEAGSTLVGLPGPCPCLDEGWSFVVQVDGVARDVVAAYARQLSDLGEAPDISDQLRDDLTLLGVRIGEGDVAEVRAVVPDSGPAYAIVTFQDRG